MVGILAAGAYVPRARLQRSVVAAAHAWFAPGLAALGKGERAMANWDEDAVTLAVEAGRDCLERQDRGRVARVVLASSSPPFADRQNASIVKEALNLRDEVATFDVGGSQRAAVAALLDAMHAARGGAGDTLCVAAEKRRVRPGSELELITGDAAAAILVGEGPCAAEFLGAHSMSLDFVDHFRAEGRDFDYGWEARWVRDEGFAKIVPAAITGALHAAGVTAPDVGRLLMGSPMAGVALVAARAAGISADAVGLGFDKVMGDAGSAQPLILLAAALEAAPKGQVLVVVGFGSGCDALVFRATGAAAVHGLGVSGWLARRKPETNYFRYLGINGLLDLDRGMRAEFDEKTSLTALYRSRKAVLALVGGKCPKTGAVQFPKSPISVGQDDRASGPQEDCPLAERRARIVTHTADSLTYSPDPPVYYGAIDFEEGGRMTVEFTDLDPEDVRVGAVMRMMFRVKAIDERRGFTRYFWKATPDYRAGQARASLAAE
jgi:hydroxymethylglutaryl-CoA synthase